MDVVQLTYRCIQSKLKIGEINITHNLKLNHVVFFKKKIILIRKSSGRLQELRPSMIQFNVPVLVVILAVE